MSTFNAVWLAGIISSVISVNICPSRYLGTARRTQINFKEVILLIVKYISVAVGWSFMSFMYIFKDFYDVFSTNSAKLSTDDLTFTNYDWSFDFKWPSFTAVPERLKLVRSNVQTLMRY